MINHFYFHFQLIGFHRFLTANVAATFRIVCATDSSGDYYVTPDGQCGIAEGSEIQNFNIDGSGNVVKA